MEGSFFDKANNELHQLWVDYKDAPFWKELYTEENKKEYSISSPLHPQYMKKEHYNDDALTFVGLNPSFGEMGRKHLKKCNPLLEFNSFPEYIKYYTFETKQPDYSHYADIQKLFSSDKRDNCYSYFQKFPELSGGLPFNHLDLLSIRSTSQERVRALFFSDSKKVDKNIETFIEKQIKIFEETLAEIKPTMIVVCNGLVSRLLRKRWGLRQEDDYYKKLGVYENILDSRSTPVFLSSMLSGGAIDNGNFERLKWHIEFVKAHLGSNVNSANSFLATIEAPERPATSAP